MVSTGRPPTAHFQRPRLPAPDGQLRCRGCHSVLRPYRRSGRVGCCCPGRQPADRRPLHGRG
eukprot:15032721-Alexandrium_andersonii.AAC.1